MWGSFATRLKWGQLVCEVEAECSAFMSCSWVTLGDLNFINRIDFIALRKKKGKKRRKNTGTVLSKHWEDRSFMNPRKESAVSFKASLRHNLQTNKKRGMYSSVSNEFHLSSRWRGSVSGCIIKQALQWVLEILLTVFSTSSSAHQPSLHDPHDPPNNCAV